jgi:hypothetical protein
MSLAVNLAQEEARLTGSRRPYDRMCVCGIAYRLFPAPLSAPQPQSAFDSGRPVPICCEVLYPILL